MLGVTFPLSYDINRFHHFSIENVMNMYFLQLFSNRTIFRRDNKAIYILISQMSMAMFAFKKPCATKHIEIYTLPRYENTYEGIITVDSSAS